MSEDLPTDLLPRTANLRLGLCDGGCVAEDAAAVEDEDMVNYEIKLIEGLPTSRVESVSKKSKG